MISFISLGFLVGVLVGLTGVGGGALMTPSLIFLGVEPLTAVGTDLVYATITRVFGVFFHNKKGHVKKDIALKLFTGSVPAIVLASIILRMVSKEEINQYLTLVLGIILVTTSSITILKGEFRKRHFNPHALVVLGFVVGLIVQFTSVGAGVIISFALINFTDLEPRYVVGTTIFYGLLLASLSALSHMSLGNVDYLLALSLIAGTIPGVYAGTHINSNIPKDKLKSLVNMIILGIGVVILLTKLGGVL
ncbi:sulfite exporter TauE/SafE family protein [Palaeococcus sp. (in: euryarchaeotes)]